VDHDDPRQTLRAQKSIKWVAEQLGHSDPAITLRIYAHVLPDEGEDLGLLEFADVSPLEQSIRLRELDRDRACRILGRPAG
jgi:hypothetical protein